MCGIYGHLKKHGKENSLHVCLEGLKKLEYRGYDSAGIAGIVNQEIIAYKTVGKVSALNKALENSPLRLDIAIAHTRWATHGGITEKNAHPHFDDKTNVAVVHNGIIENYQKLKAFLIREGITFYSETDTEVISQLIAYYYESNLLEAVQKTLKELEGSFAFACIHKNHPDTLIAAVSTCPLSIGVCKITQDQFIASDSYAFSGRPLDVFHLHDNECAVLTKEGFQIYNEKGSEIKKESESLDIEKNEITKEGFEHFLIKEIYEQPETIEKALRNRIDEKNGTAHFEELKISDAVLKKVDQVVIIGCGSSYHAGFAIASILESCAKIPTRVEIASEFRYTDPLLSPDALIIVISQSGETADTLAALRQVQTQRCPTIAICNVKGSSLTRLATSSLLLHAGPEISVCSSKAFTSQLTLLLLLALKLSRLKGMPLEEGKKFIQELHELSKYALLVLEKEKEIASFARKYGHFQHFFFIGRKQMYPTCLESALKLKEISYLHATGYPAGEMKHGPIALISEDVPTIAFCGNKHTQDKMIGSLMEIKARGGPILGFIPSDFNEAIAILDDYITLPSEIQDFFAPIPYAIAGQIFAYHMAKIHGTDIDQPRNLAKSVTVE